MYRSLIFASLCPLLLALPGQPGDKPGSAPPGIAPLIMDTTAGKEAKLRTWRLTTGVRRLPVDAGKGPLCLEFRDEHSTTYQAGILTLVPITSLRRLDYDHARKTVTAVVAAAGKDIALSGPTKYQGINRVTVEGEIDLGGLGSAAIKYQGGSPKGVIRSLRFPMPEALPPPKGALAVVIGEDKAKTRREIAEPTVLYQLPGGTTRLVPQLYFQKTVKIDLPKIASLRHVEPEDKKQTSYDFEVTLTDGAKHTLTLLTKVDLDGKKGATLLGVFGRAAEGYQLFPAHTIAELRMPAGK